MKVLLVNAPPYKIQEANYDTPDFPRTGLAYLAGMLRGKGVEVDVLDCKYDRLSQDDAVRAIAAANPDLVGYTAFTNEVMQAGRLSADVKEKLPHSKSIIGGVHATVLPERTLREFPSFDFVCVGEGEMALLEFVKALESKSDISSVLGIAYLDENKKYVFTGERPKIDDLDTIPPPAWDMFRPAKGYSFNSQRGCPYHCPFCVNPNGRKVRKESVERVIGQMTMLYEKHGANFTFGDEVFTIDRERTIQFCDKLIETGLNKKVHWDCQTHINCIDYELAKKLKEAGCRGVGLGVESGDPERLLKIDKGTTPEKIIAVVKQIQKANLPVNAFFILGQPDETEKTAKDTIKFAVKLNTSTTSIGIMVPYPGTEIGRMAERGEGGYILTAKDWNSYNKQIGSALEFRGVKRKTLERIQLMGSIKVLLCNFHFIALFKRAWRFRIVAFHILKKAIGLREN